MGQKWGRRPNIYFIINHSITDIILILSLPIQEHHSGNHSSLLHLQFFPQHTNVLLFPSLSTIYYHLLEWYSSKHCPALAIYNPFLSLSLLPISGRLLPLLPPSKCSFQSHHLHVAKPTGQRSVCVFPDPSAHLTWSSFPFPGCTFLTWFLEHHTLFISPFLTCLFFFMTLFFSPWLITLAQSLVLFLAFSLTFSWSSQPVSWIPYLFQAQPLSWTQDLRLLLPIWHFRVYLVDLSSSTYPTLKLLIGPLPSKYLLHS